MSGPRRNATSPPSDLDPCVADLTRHKVRRLRTAGALSFHDGEDLAQELSLQAHVATPKYIAARGARATFYEAVLARRVASFLSARSAQKRDLRRARPLDGVPAEQFRGTAGPRSDVALDVRDALATLPEDLRAFAQLSAELSEAEVIRASGLSRQQIRGRRRRIAHHLQRRGLG